MGTVTSRVDVPSAGVPGNVDEVVLERDPLEAEEWLALGRPALEREALSRGFVPGAFLRLTDADMALVLSRDVRPDADGLIPAGSVGGHGQGVQAADRVGVHGQDARATAGSEYSAAGSEFPMAPEDSKGEVSDREAELRALSFDALMELVGRYRLSREVMGSPLRPTASSLVDLILRHECVREVWGVLSDHAVRTASHDRHPQRAMGAHVAGVMSKVEDGRGGTRPSPAGRFAVSGKSGPAFDGASNVRPFERPDFGETGAAGPARAALQARAAQPGVRVTPESVAFRAWNETGVAPRSLTLYCEGRVSEYKGDGDVALAVVALESWDLRDAAGLSEDQALASAFDALLLAGQSTGAARSHFVAVAALCLERFTA